MGRPAREIPIPASAVSVLARLWSAGHAAYLVGGTVRDALLGLPPHDVVDVATDATPERLQQLFPEGRYENKFGMVRLPEAEVTTFRRDHDYGDHRRPDSVTFTTDLAEDLARRDFTVNALAYGRPAAPQPQSPTGGLPALELVDPTGGIADLERRVLRAVGDPDRRFDEDALRLLRAARFASQLGFDIEESTLSAMARHASDVAHVSRERLGQELRRMLDSTAPSRGFRVLQQTGLLKGVLPELAAQIGVPQNKRAGSDLFDHTLETLDAAASIAVRGEPRTRLLFAALLHDVGKPETFRDGRFLGHDAVGAEVATRVLDRLALGRREAEPIVKLVRLHMFNSPEHGSDPPLWSDAAIRRFIRRVGPELVGDLFLLREADNIGSGLPATAGGLDQLRRRVAAELERHVPLGLGDLAVDGEDLKRELGLVEGPQIGIMLNRLLESVVTDPTRNTRSRLLEEARKTARTLGGPI